MNRPRKVLRIAEALHATALRANVHASAADVLIAAGAVMFPSAGHGQPSEYL